MTEKDKSQQGTFDFPENTQQPTRAGSINESVLGFDKSKEQIPRQINHVAPIRTVYGETRRKSLAKQIENGTRKFYEEGVIGLVEDREGLEFYAKKVAQFKYNRDNVMFGDLAAGLFSALTDPAQKTQLYDVRAPVDPKTGEMASIMGTVSLEGTHKLILGPTVNDNGRAIHGAGPVVKELREQINHTIQQVLTGGAGEPYAIASVNVPHIGNALIVGRPVTIRTVGGGAIQFELNPYFFPFAGDSIDNLKSSEKMIYIPAGLYALSAVGRYQLYQKLKDAGKLRNLPQAIVTHRICRYIQTAFEMYAFAPGFVQQTASNRYNITYKRKETIKDLVPSAINSKTGQVNFLTASETIAKAGQIFWQGIETTGILNQLNPKILVPALDAGAEFPDDKAGGKKIVFLKADEIGKIQKGINHKKAK